MDKATLEIGGMTCGHCVGAVSKALRKLPGVAVEQVAIGSAVVSYDAGKVSAAEIARAVTDEGYPVIATR